jgi:hypothetical protein
MMPTKIIDLPNYRLDLHLRGSNTLVVTFESYIPDPPPIDRPGWGAFALWNRPEDWLSVKTKDGRNYYRRQDWFDWLADRGPLLAMYDRIVLMGTSMGGYASLAFSRALRATEVLAIAPISTLAPNIATWDSRVPSNVDEDWTGPYRDAVDEMTGRVWLVSDPFDSYDRKHLRRLEPKAYDTILFPAVGHFVAEWLHRLGCLRPAVHALLDGDNPAPILRAGIARRRELEQYWGMMVGHQRDRGRHRLFCRLGEEMSRRRAAGQLIPIDMD